MLDAVQTVAMFVVPVMIGGAICCVIGYFIGRSSVKQADQSVEMFEQDDGMRKLAESLREQAEEDMTKKRKDRTMWD